MQAIATNGHKHTILVRELSNDIVSISITYKSSGRYDYAIGSYFVDSYSNCIQFNMYDENENSYMLNIFPSNQQEKELLINKTCNSFTLFSRGKETEHIVFVKVRHLCMTQPSIVCMG